MFDHVALHVSDMAPYVAPLRALGAEPRWQDHEITEWDDFDVDTQSPPTRRVHVGLVAPDLAAIEAFWQAGLEAGFADGGRPGPRPEYGDDYAGGFLRDPHGNSIEACLHDRARPPGLVDHVWLRVRDLAASRAFYAAVAPHTGFALVVDEPGLARFRGPSASFTVLEGEPTENLHIAFPASDDAIVRDFHAAALAAGARDNGPPGERPAYHPGYYGAFALDPDGNNVEVVNHNR